jgi:hypothetical protein
VGLWFYAANESKRSWVRISVGPIYYFSDKIHQNRKIGIESVKSEAPDVERCTTLYIELTSRNRWLYEYLSLSVAIVLSNQSEKNSVKECFEGKSLPIFKEISDKKVFGN